MQRTGRLCLMVATLMLFAGAVNGALTKKSDVRNSKHNLSATSSTATRTITATTETQICVFCHTPHGATKAELTSGTAITTAQLWNRRVPAATTYTGYTSSSLDAATIQAGFNGQPAGSSKLCLSCHDGTLALGSVNVLNGVGVANGLGQAVGVNIAMTGGVTTLPAGTYGATSGFTAVIGTNLANDHPISVDFTNALALRDGELRPVAATATQNWTSGAGVDVIGNRSPGYHPVLPLEGTGSGGTGQVQCAACHDPHIVDTDATKGDQMFLRLNRFQEAAPTGTFDRANDIVCLGCHEKNYGAVGAWSYSSHGNNLVATQTYVAATVTPRQFPAGKTVWSASCLNCHNSHAPQGAKHLLSEGTDGAFIGAASAVLGGARQGGNAASENTCFQCHTAAANSIITSTNPLIDIQTQTALGSRHPIVVNPEVHDIGGNFNDAGFVDCTTATNKCGADGVERRSLLGVGVSTNRHAECTDCHNPHRVAKVQKISDVISGAGYAAGGVHRHEDITGYVHDNTASGVLRGTWGVEPTYANASFHNLPSGYIVKRGDPGTTPTIPVATAMGAAITQTYVTREYQVCLKCHSDYGYSDSNVYGTAAEATSGRPVMGGAGETVTNSNGRTNFTTYTNQAKEFQAPAGHVGGSGAGDTPTNFNSGNDGGAGMPTTTAASAYCTTANTSLCNNNNHRSWHPVFGPTGRKSWGAYYAPWSNAGARGVQTMYCSDCHGSVTPVSTVIPTSRSPTGVHVAASQSWGPHGGTTTSGTQVFMLKGVWNNTTAYSNASTSVLCFKCHCPNAYTNVANAAGCVNGTQGLSGFYNSTNSNVAHKGRSDHYSVPCQYCHVAIVHGWKNKSFLVNLEDIGPEAGSTVTSSAPTSSTFTKGPYYAGAGLRIKSFGVSGNWDQPNCAMYNNGH